MRAGLLLTIRWKEETIRLLFIRNEPLASARMSWIQNRSHPEWRLSVLERDPADEWYVLSSEYVEEVAFEVF